MADYQKYLCITTICTLIIYKYSFFLLLLCIFVIFFVLNLLHLIVEILNSSDFDLKKIIPSKYLVYEKPAVVELKFENNYLKIPPTVDRALTSFLNAVLKKYIDSWYFDILESKNEQFIVMIKHELRQLINNIVQRLCTVDLTELIIENGIPHASSHLEAFLRYKRTAVNELCEKDFLNFLQLNNSMHQAVFCRHAEITYIRNCTETIFDKFVDSNIFSQSESKIPVEKWPIHCRHILREIVSCGVLLPLLDLIASPNIIFHLLTLLFSEGTIEMFTDAPEEKVPILQVFEDNISKARCSLFSVTLEQINQSPEHSANFNTFLKCNRGPINQFNFLHLANEIVLQLREKSLSKESAAKINYNCWELYREFLRPESENFIKTRRVSPKILSAVASALHCSSLNTDQQSVASLEKCLLQIYNAVAVELSDIWLAKYVTSEQYIQFLAGPRPKIAMTEEHERKRNLRASSLPPSASFKQKLKDANDQKSSSAQMTLSQKLRNIILPKTEEGTMIASTFFPDNDDEDYLDLPYEKADQQSIDQCDLEDESDIENPPTVLMVEPPSDLHAWSVKVPCVEPRKDASGRTQYLYIIEVQRRDLDEMREWTIDRRYQEFYMLEAKLIEFHGSELVMPFLPSKKPFYNKNRDFIENHRSTFEGFLQRMCLKSTLRHSELMAAFLQSQEVFRENLILDVISMPWRGMKRVGAKMVRERGQHLADFLQDLERIALGEELNEKLKPVASMRSIKRTTPEPKIKPTTFLKTLCTDEFGNNYQYDDCVKYDYACVDYKQTNEKLCGSGVTGVYDLLLYLLIEVANATGIFVTLLKKFRSVLKLLFDKLVTMALRTQLTAALHERQIAQLIDLANESIFETTTSENIDYEQKARSNSKRFLLNDLKLVPILIGDEPVNECLDVIVTVLRYPVANKNLLYKLFDVIFQKLVLNSS